MLEVKSRNISQSCNITYAYTVSCPFIITKCFFFLQESITLRHLWFKIKKRVSECLPLRETVHGCWRQTEDKCDWLNGREQHRPSEQLQHRLAATPSVWTQCSANTLTMTSWHHCLLTKKNAYCGWKRGFIYLILLNYIQGVLSPLLTFYQEDPTETLSLAISDQLMG